MTVTYRKGERPCEYQRRKEQAKRDAMSPTELAEYLEGKRLQRIANRALSSRWQWEKVWRRKAIRDGHLRPDPPDWLAYVGEQPFDERLDDAAIMARVREAVAWAAWVPR